MREIKFRAWDKREKRMCAPYDGDFIRWHAPSNWKDCYELMQFTGLQDKNGKDIYEGDIISCRMSVAGGGWLPHMGQVVYSNDFAAFATKNQAGETLIHKHLLNTFFIEGNVLENHELLEQSS